MTCYTPLQGYESKELTATGKRKTTFSIHKARGYEYGLPVKRVVPCNRCSGCRLQYSREWAVRCMHEASLYGDRNSFITLTYNDKYLPLYGSLNYEHWTKFMKRLRKNVKSKSYMSKFGLSPYKEKIRFYMGPEYGDENLRPHYHAIIFNFDFPDKEHFMTRQGHKLYRSPLLESLWVDPDTEESMGFSTIGSCTFQSAAYVARYMMKKVKGDDIDSRYQRVDLLTGEVIEVEPEKARMSNQCGIAKEWFDRYYKSDVYNKDYITMGNGIIVCPPKYYDSLLERISPEELEIIKQARTQSMLENAENYTPDRLAVRYKCHLDKAKLLKRDISRSC